MQAQGNANGDIGRKHEVPAAPAPAAPLRMSAPVPAISLPPPDSDEWEETPVPMPSLALRTAGGKPPVAKVGRKF